MRRIRSQKKPAAERFAPPSARSAFSTAGQACPAATGINLAAEVKPLGTSSNAGSRVKPPAHCHVELYVAKLVIPSCLCLLLA